jgi:hypothetical protein
MLEWERCTFFVYESWVNKRAMIHAGRCGMCSGGHGCHGTDHITNGRWMGPYLSIKSAEEVAFATGREVRRHNKCTDKDF